MLNANYNPDVLSCLANLSNDEVFTPPTIVNNILDMLPPELWRDKTVTFLDPVSKSGVFLREIAKRLINGLAEEFPDQQERLNHIFKNQLFGVALTELTALLSRRSLYCSKSADGKYSICDEFDTESGNIKFQRIEHSWKSGKCKYCGANQEVYSRGEHLETHAYEFIHTDKPKEVLKMKFDVIVGNPPYQLSDGGYGISATPIYHKFVEQAKKLNPRFLSMIIPARWFSGGKGMDGFRAVMLNDNRLTQIHDYPDASDCFPGVQIKGGICYFLWDRDNPSECKVTTYDKGDVTSSTTRPLLEEGCDVFIRYNQAISILNKVKIHGEKSIRPNVSSRKPFGLTTTFKGSKRKNTGDVKLFQNGGVGYTSRDTILTNRKLIDAHKVLIPRAGSGSDSFPHSILGRPFYAEPNTACTETYLVVSEVKNKKEAQHLITYISTKFFRFLVLLNKPTQDATNKVYGFVPIQDLSINWSDESLYQKYQLETDEVAFIESMIRPMELAE